MIAGPAVPTHVTGRQLNSPLNDLQGRLAGVLMIVEDALSHQRDQGLTQDMLVTAVDGVGAAAAGAVVGGEVLTG